MDHQIGQGDQRNLQNDIDDDNANNANNDDWEDVEDDDEIFLPQRLQPLEPTATDTPQLVNQIPSMSVQSLMDQLMLYGLTSNKAEEWT